MADTGRRPLRTVLHAGPIATLVLITTITLSVIYCSLMWWPPHSSLLGLLTLTSFLTFSGLTMYNFICAMFKGPGYLPLKWRPADKITCSKLQECKVCAGYKAPRSHHCRQCARCVTKMDHHCPWINGCVGHRNQTNFIGFLASASIGCSQATVILACSIYHAVYRTYYLYYHMDAPIVYLGLYGFLWCLFSLGCAFGVAFGVSLLLYYQLKIVWRNRTSIEDWIEEKAQYRRRRSPDLPKFIYPYDLGRKANILSVLNLSGQPIGDGISWPVVDGCDQYTLTIEQLEQKNDKRERTREYVVVEDYTGSWCPISKGCGVFFHPPCSDESRIRLFQEDKVLVSRWKKHWLYGEKYSDISVAENKEPLKGWFPRRCAAEVIDTFPDDKAASGEVVPPLAQKTISGNKLNNKKVN